MAPMPGKVEAASDAMRQSLAGYCRSMAELTGDGRWKRAAGVLAGGLGGRKSLPDDVPMSYARTLLASGVARSIHQACLLAAQFYAPAHQVDTVRDRLRRKFRTKRVKSED